MSAREAAKWQFGEVAIQMMGQVKPGEMEALMAATRTCADLCGVVDQLGTVEVDKLADLIVLSGDPLDSISNIRKLRLVLKGGQLVNIQQQEGLTGLWELLFF